MKPKKEPKVPGEYTKQALEDFLEHVEEMRAHTLAALRGDLESLDEIVSEYCGPHTKASSLAREVGGGIQADEDVAAEYEAEQAAAEAAGQRQAEAEQAAADLGAEEKDETQLPPW